MNIFERIVIGIGLIIIALAIYFKPIAFTTKEVNPATTKEEAPKVGFIDCYFADGTGPAYDCPAVLRCYKTRNGKYHGSEGMPCPVSDKF